MSAITLLVKDAANATQSLSGSQDPTNANAFVGATSLADPTTGVKAQIAAFHNADNQQPGGTAYGMLTGGVAQLLNFAGNLDRQRETGLDGVSALGISSGAMSLAMGFKTSIPGVVTLNAAPQAVTPAAMSGTVGGVKWAIQVGCTVLVDLGANQEAVYVTAVSSTQFTGIFTKSHGAGAVVVGTVFNQERDAAGEADGATGIGTAVAAEYEYNGGAPGGGNFDRARSVQAKGRTTAAISAGGGAASTQLTVGAAGTLKAGMQVMLLKAGTFPAAGSFESVYVDFSYIEGSVTVPLASAIVAAVGYDTIAYDAFGSNGPGLNGFLPIGVGIEEEAVYDPVTGLFFLGRAATADAMAAANTPAEAIALWNGATMDRARGNVDTAALITAAGATTTQTSADQTNVNGRGAKVVLDMTVVGTGNVTLTIQGKDAASGKYYTLLAGVAVSTNSTNVYEVYPGIPAAANAAASATLPRTWRVLVTANNANATTYTVGASVIV